MNSKTIPVYQFASYDQELSTPSLASLTHTVLNTELIKLGTQITSGRIPLSELSLEIHRAMVRTGAPWSISRACVAIVTPFSQRLNVASVYQELGSMGSPSAANSMDVGYYCYVGTKSSVFQIGDSSVRVCSNLEQVLEQFKSKNMPIQRSIARLYQMGIRSSLALTTAVGKVGQGFLFLNSNETGHFDETAIQNADLLWTLKLLLSTALTHYFGGLFLFNPALSNHLSDDTAQYTVLDGDSFGVAVEGYFSRFAHQSCKIKFETSVSHPFFCALSWILFLIGEIAFQKYHFGDSRELEISLRETEVLSFYTVKVSTGRSRYAQGIQSQFEGMAALLGVKLSLHDDFFELFTELQPASAEEQKWKYSV